ncbi:MAG: C25 family cysteine peptidase, partial [Anaerolineae bacterium]|nr:C25 family cysteine peptidase [Candidatus Roseilinea sp.]MDW8449996.1 C25 family cysteine peptidase [Anaerolineae bacterium]
VFVGHASPRQWAAERLFHLDDVPSLAPAIAQPVVVGLTCYTGRFHELQNALDEALLRAPGRGAVGTWGATGLTISSGHDPLGREFVSVWLAGGRLGEAALVGKLSLSAGGLYLDLLDTYVLLGDPTLLPNQRWAVQGTYLPIVRR